MPYTIGRLMFDMSVIGGEFASEFSFAKAKMAAEEALGIFFSSRWPFSEGEGVVTCVAPYTTGTVAVVNGQASVVGTGTTWNTAWITPAIIRIEGSSGDTVQVATFNSTTGLTLDVPWPFDSDPTATYSIEFPAHAIDSYITVRGVTQARLSTMFTLRASTFESMLANRPLFPQSFWPGEWAVQPGDGVTGQKLFIWPPPASVQTLRYRYVKAVPAFRYYRTGTASLANAGTALTGQGTLWAKQGYSMVGQYFEFQDQPGHQNLISVVGSDTAATVAAFGGQTAVETPYSISPSILCPDDLKPLLRSIVRWKYLQDAAPKLAGEAERRFRQLRDQAISRYDVGRDIGVMEPIMTGDVDWGAPPPIPTILRSE